MNKETVLTAEGLGKRYLKGASAVWALRDVNLSLHSAHTTMVVGPSGAGKSTLLYVLAGLEAPTEGKVRLLGQDLYSLSDSKLSRLRSQAFGFVFQSFNLIPSLMAVENVEVPLRIAGARNARKRAVQMLEALGLGNRITHRPGELSGGEQQRVAIARALVNEPKIIFADEPTGDLDSKTGEEVLELLLGLVREKGISCCMVTHNRNWCRLADAVVELRDGRIVEGGLEACSA
jgi:putative ABC transport system ATP-binding protein